MSKKIFLTMMALMFIKDPAVNGRLPTGSRRLPSCKDEPCSESHYCSKRNLCRPTKYDGQTCQEDEYCKSAICVDNVCKACRVDNDCPSMAGKIAFRYQISAHQSTAYCLNNDCVACKQDDHCEEGKICTTDHKCEECDSDDDCRDGKVCSKNGVHNWCETCFKDDHCPGDKKCSYGKCVECKVDSDCSTGRCHVAKCVDPVCNGVCSSDSGCKSGSCYKTRSFLRGARRNLFGYCKSCDE